MADPKTVAVSLTDFWVRPYIYSSFDRLERSECADALIMMLCVSEGKKKKKYVRLRQGQRNLLSLVAAGCCLLQSVTVVNYYQVSQPSHFIFCGRPRISPDTGSNNLTKTQHKKIYT